MVSTAPYPDGRFLASVAKKSGKYGLSIRQVSPGSDVVASSPDGESHYLRRGDVTTDVVLITNFR